MSTPPCTPCKVSVSNLPSGGKMKWELKGMWPFILWGEKKEKKKGKKPLQKSPRSWPVERKQTGSCGGIFILANKCQLWTTWKPYIIIIKGEEDLSLGNQELVFILHDFIHLSVLSTNACFIEVLFWVFFNGEESMKGEWRGNLLSGILSPFMSFFSTLAGYDPWSYIQGVRYKGLGGMSANFSHLQAPITQRERERAVFKPQRHKDGIWERTSDPCLFILSQVVKQDFNNYGLQVDEIYKLILECVSHHFTVES